VLAVLAGVAAGFVVAALVADAPAGVAPGPGPALELALAVVAVTLLLGAVAVTLRFRRRRPATAFVGDGVGGVAPAVVEGRVRLGVQSRPLTASLDGLEDHLRGWIEADRDHDYVLVRIVCAFLPEPRERITRAEVTATLDAAPDLPSPPCVWSLWPKHVAGGGTVTRTATIGADLKILSAVGSVERSAPARGEVAGSGELQARAVWELQGDAVGRETGLALVVQQAAGTTSSCRITVLVDVAARDGVRTYRAVLPPEQAWLELRSGG
jgi:hypothetical protein